MQRLLSFLFLIIPFCLTYAQSSKPEAPTETANPVVVIAFLAIFVGACIAYIVYAVIAGRKKKGDGE